MNIQSRVWSLQEAKARLSEVVRLAQSEGPQTVTVHGKAAVIIQAAAENARDMETGSGLVALLSKSPLKRLTAESVERVKSYAGTRVIEL